MVRHAPAVAALVSLLLLGAGLSSARAQDYRLPPKGGEDREGIELGKHVRLKPFFRVSSWYSSNVLQEPNQLKKGDYITSLTPGLDVTIGDRDGSYFEAGYAASWAGYGKIEGLNNWEHRLHASGHAEVSKFTFDGYGKAAWAWTSSDPRFTGQVRTFTGDGLLEATWDPTDTVGLRVDGQGERLYYYDEQLETVNNYMWRTGAFLVLNPNLPFDSEFELGGNYREIIYTDKDTQNPDLALASAQAGFRTDTKVVTFRGRAGYEWAWVKIHRRTYPHGAQPSDSFFGDGSATVYATKLTELTVSAGHRLQYTGNGLWQRNTRFGGQINQKLPLDWIMLFALGEYEHQDPKGGTDLYTQTYRGGIVLTPVRYVELSGQGSYTRSSGRSGMYEVWTAGISLTLQY